MDDFTIQNRFYSMYIRSSALMTEELCTSSPTSHWQLIWETKCTWKADGWGWGGEREGRGRDADISESMLDEYKPLLYFSREMVSFSKLHNLISIFFFGVYDIIFLSRLSW